MNDIQLITQEAESHKAAAMTIGMWIIREIPVAKRWFESSVWPKLVSAYPYCRDNGGVWGIIKNFFAGKQTTQQVETK